MAMAKGGLSMPKTSVESTPPSEGASPVKAAQRPAESTGADREIRIIRQNALSHILGAPWFALGAAGLKDEENLERAFPLADKVVAWVTR